MFICAISMNELGVFGLVSSCCVWPATVTVAARVGGTGDRAGPAGATIGETGKLYTYCWNGGLGDTDAGE